MSDNAGLLDDGTWQVRVRGTDEVLANVRITYDENDYGMKVEYQENGTGPWIEDPEAFGLLLGDYGAVTKIA